MIRNSHCGFVNSKSCQTNLISFFDGVIGLADPGGGRAADAIHLGFIKASHTVLLVNLGKMTWAAPRVEIPTEEELPSMCSSPGRAFRMGSPACPGLESVQFAFQHGWG